MDKSQRQTDTKWEINEDNNVHISIQHVQMVRKFYTGFNPRATFVPITLRHIWLFYLLVRHAGIKSMKRLQYEM